MKMAAIKHVAALAAIIVALAVAGGCGKQAAPDHDAVVVPSAPAAPPASETAPAETAPDANIAEAPPPPAELNMTGLDDARKQVALVLVDLQKAWQAANTEMFMRHVSDNFANPDGNREALRVELPGVMGMPNAALRYGNVQIDSKGGDMMTAKGIEIYAFNSKHLGDVSFFFKKEGEEWRLVSTYTKADSTALQQSTSDVPDVFDEQGAYEPATESQY